MVLSAEPVAKEASSRQLRSRMGASCAPAHFCCVCTTWLRSFVLALIDKERDRQVGKCVRVKRVCAYLARLGVPDHAGLVVRAAGDEARLLWLVL